MKSIQLTAYGDPTEVVRLVDAAEVGEPQANEVIIQVEAAPVEPSDLYMIAGVYGNLPQLPHILGIQGVGRVSKVGRDIRHLKEGDRTLVPPFVPSWTERVRADATWLRPLPKADLNQLAMLGINPATAYLIFTEFSKLRAGDWLVQNAANSSVGRAVLAIAQTKGVKTVNVVRRQDVADQIWALGADVVLVDGPDLPARIAKATHNAQISLALDGVGDSATQDLLSSLTLYGTAVIWSGMSGKPFTASGPRLLFYGQSIRGFWIFNWFKTAVPEKITAVYEEILPLVVAGDISFPIAGEFSFEQHQQAIAVASHYSGKAILKPHL